MAYKGKTTCRILKDIRRQIAEANDIDLVIKECTYQGDCAGTCPRCEAEVAYLERELARREALGKVVRVTGLAAATFAAAACSLKPKQQAITLEEEDLIYEGDLESDRCGEIAPVQEETDTNWMAGGKPLDPKYLEENKSTQLDKSASKSGCKNKDVESSDEVVITEKDVKSQEELALQTYMGEEEIEGDMPFVIVEGMPSFPGGQEAMLQFLAENVKYPVIAQEKGIQGRVICQFVVDKDGSIVDLEVVRSCGDASLDKEAVRVINSMPKWKPGNQRGKTVRVKYTLPISFKIPD